MADLAVDLNLHPDSVEAYDRRASIYIRCRKQMTLQLAKKAGKEKDYTDAAIRLKQLK